MTDIFETRETYLAFVTKWKAEYAALSREIRALKTSIKAAANSGDQPGLQSARAFARAQAYEMLLMRHSAKQAAAKHRLASKETA